MEGDCAKCKELCQSALDKAQTIEQSCTASAKAAGDAAMRAETPLAEPKLPLKSAKRCSRNT